MLKQIKEDCLYFNKTLLTKLSNEIVNRFNGFSAFASLNTKTWFDKLVIDTIKETYI